MENNIDEERIVLAGIPENGVVIAKAIQRALSDISPLETELMTISLNKRHPKEVTLSKKLDFNGQVVIIVDDVVNSRKTLLYSVKPFLEFQPKKIQTQVLVESHNNFPVQPDYVGLSISTTLLEHISWKCRVMRLQEPICNRYFAFYKLKFPFRLTGLFYLSFLANFIFIAAFGIQKLPFKKPYCVLNDIVFQHHK